MIARGEYFTISKFLVATPISLRFFKRVRTRCHYLEIGVAGGLSVPRGAHAAEMTTADKSNRSESGTTPVIVTLFRRHADWDRLFGTYAEERAPVIYGVSNLEQTRNPLKVLFGGWKLIWKPRKERHQL